MARLHFNLDNRKYMLEFLPDNQVKITQPDNRNKFITVRYSPCTGVIDFIQCIKSWNFSKLKYNELLMGGKI